MANPTNQFDGQDQRPQLGIRDRRAAELGQWRRRTNDRRGFSRGLFIAIVIGAVLGIIAGHAFPVPQL